MVWFSDGQVGSTMETASDFSAWSGTTTSGTGTNAVNNTWAHHGSNGCKHVCPAWSSCFLYKSFTAGAEHNFRYYLKITDSSLGAGEIMDFVRLLSVGNFDMVLLGVIDADRKLHLSVQNNAFTMDNFTSATTLSLNTEYCLELQLTKVDADHIAVKVYLNGGEIADLTQANHHFDYPDLADRVQWGLIASVDDSMTLYGDCYVIDSAYIGPEAAGGPTVKKGSIAPAMTVLLTKFSALKQPREPRFQPRTFPKCTPRILV